jgi:1-deoxy-D-xylulose-5-phosphate reductoisomerase
MPKKISILGSTGSIGKQTLEVVSAFPDRLEVVGIVAKDEVDLIAAQIKKFSPKIVSVENENVKQKLFKKLGKDKTKIVCGSKGLIEVAAVSDSELVVAAIPGLVSIEAVFKAIEDKKDIALATKEILVAAGDLFMRKAESAGIKIFPIDSEHSAIEQCLAGENFKAIRKIILTCSGGPFLKIPADRFGKLTAKDALSHPTWKMGLKITIDSATLMNKGFEVIEAHHLFNIDYSKIEVVVHPQSIIHSMVEFLDGSIKAQLAVPDMRIPIQYALLGKERRENKWGRIDFKEIKEMNFLEPDLEKFPCLEYAYEAGEKGGAMPVALNAADEEAVKLFLEGKINFGEIAPKIKSIMGNFTNRKINSLKDVIEVDKNTRKSSL